MWTTIGIACVGGLFDHSRFPGESSHDPVSAYVIVGLFSLGLVLAIQAVVRAAGARLLISSVVALELWYMLIVAAIALMTVTGESPM